MGKRKVVRRLSNSLTEEQKEKVRKQNEKRKKEAIGRARVTIKPSSQTSESPKAVDQQAKGKSIAAKKIEKKQESIEKLTPGSNRQKNGQESTEIQKNTQAFDTKPKLQKRKRFEERHKRITTYVLLEHHQKLNDARMNYGIPITETVNNALEEYFDKYNL